MYPDSCSGKTLSEQIADDLLKDPFDASPDCRGRWTHIRGRAGELIRAILSCCPANSDREAAIRKVREAVWAVEGSLIVPHDKLGDF